jgi:hypothetical protein
MEGTYRYFTTELATVLILEFDSKVPGGDDLGVLEHDILCCSEDTMAIPMSKCVLESFYALRVVFPARLACYPPLASNLERNRGGREAWRRELAIVCGI